MYVYIYMYMLKSKYKTSMRIRQKERDKIMKSCSLLNMKQARPPFFVTAGHCKRVQRNTWARSLQTMQPQVSAAQDPEKVRSTQVATAAGDALQCRKALSYPKEQQQ